MTALSVMQKKNNSLSLYTIILWFFFVLYIRHRNVCVIVVLLQVKHVRIQCKLE